ncbi:hypothetical protein KIW84_051258 [Lathyrus oleraceus]|uniref:Retroviral polymerase SH3-like domain-containing protein n=1 Tax=Pisum sativum TaxID=3888 RepID=A0A9D4WM18_PEA|nr:hypothetical protein KIW84_051258 [Pisum sativum]
MHSLKVFGSLAFASTFNVHRTKLESRARKCVFLGYKNGMKGVVLYDIHSHSILISRNVIHHEHIFPYSNSDSINWDYHLHKDSIELFQQPVIHVPSQNIEPANDEHDNQHTIANDTLHHYNSDPEIVENTDENNDTQHILDTHDTENCNTQSRPVRTKQTPHYLSDYVCNISDVSAVKSSSDMILHHKVPCSQFVFDQAQRCIAKMILLAGPSVAISTIFLGVVLWYENLCV